MCSVTAATGCQIILHHTYSMYTLQQERGAWGSIFQYNTLYHIFISLGTKETMHKDLLHVYPTIQWPAAKDRQIYFYSVVLLTKLPIWKYTYYVHSHFSSMTWTCCSGWIVDTTGYLVEVMEGSAGKYLRRITAILPLSTANKQLPLYVWVSYATLGSLHTKRHNLQLVKLETCCDLQHINYSM